MEIPQPRLIPKILFVLFAVCPLLFFTDLTRNPYYTQIVLLNLCVNVYWLVWLIHAWRTREWIWVSTALDIPFFCFIGVCLVSWVSSFLQHPAFTKSILSEGTRSFIFIIVNAFLVYQAAIRNPQPSQFKKLLWLCYAVTLIASVYGIAQYFGEEWIWPRSLNPYGSRPVSTFGNPNFLSSYLVLMLPVAAADCIWKATGVPRALLVLVITAASMALLCTLTRSSWIGAIWGLTFVIARPREASYTSAVFKWKRALALGFVALVIFWPKSSSSGYSATPMQRFGEISKIKEGQYSSVTQRQLIWSSAWEMVLDHPWLGKGAGCFELFYPFYQGALLPRAEFRGWRTHANNAHNEILENWSQIGTIGLGIVIWLWWVFFCSASSSARRLELPWSALQWALIAGVSGMLLDNLLNVTIHFAVPAMVFWWWVGSAFVLDPQSRQVQKIPVQGWLGRGSLALAGVLLIMLMVRSVSAWAEEIYFFKGFKLSKSGVDLLSASHQLETAFHYFPYDVNNNYELANVYARTSYRDKALAMYQKALDANSGYDEIYFNQGTILMQMGRIDEAIRNYKITFAINPLSREVCNALINVYLHDVPRYGEEAEKLFKQILSLYPNDKDFWNNYGYLETQKGLVAEARSAYEQALKLDPNFALAKQNLAVLQRAPLKAGSASAEKVPKR